MPFSNKNRPDIKNIYQFKEYGLQRIPIELLKTNCIRERQGIFTVQHSSADTVCCKGDKR